MRDRVNINSLAGYFPDEKSHVIGHVQQLHGQSLSALRLLGFIKQDPISRTPLIERLAQEGADVKRFNDQISLAVFPDPVAYRLAATEGINCLSVARIIDYSKHWRSGAHFIDPLSEHVK